MRYRVAVDGLNLRSKPEVRPGTVIAVLRRGDLVTALDQSSQEWWRVRATVGSLAVEGFVAVRYLAPDADFEPPVPVAGEVPPVHMPVDRWSGARDTAARRAYPLNEPGQPTRQGVEDATRSRELSAIVEWLDVERSVRYHPGASTYCNIYAYDYCFLAGIYLPRVWWTAPALQELAAGRPVVPVYDTTLREMSANSLHDWLADWGPRFGWRRTLSLTELQDQANRGRVALICARNRNRNRSGHICAVVPETATQIAVRSGAEVTGPLQSQAGRTNHRYRTFVWWATATFDGVGFWWVQ